MAKRQRITVDGNEAAASVAYRLSEVIAIYPITPSSTMGELGDEWVSKGKTNIWGVVPEMAEMQSEGGAAGRGPRRAAGGGAGHDLHRLPGPAADDPQHVQDRGRADALRHARGRAHAGHPRALDLRRPLGRDGLPPDRLRPARARARCRRRTTWPPSPTPRPSSRACPSCTSSTASAPRTRWRRSSSSTDDDLRSLISRGGGRAPTASARSPPTGPCSAAPPRTPTSSSRPARPRTRFYDACPGIVQRA